MLLKPYRKLFLLPTILSVLCFADLQAQVPTITSFSPISANQGVVVTLEGTNFNTIPTNNIVFFGATRATVTACTDTSVSVIVPVSATYAPITLLNTGTRLATNSSSNFIPTYSPTKAAVNAINFQTRQTFTTGSNPISVAMGDFDGDGKPDLVVANYDIDSVSVYRNTSIIGSIGSGSFATKVNFATGSGPHSLAIGDLNGDGKLDLVVANYFSESVSVISNTSASDSIGFAAKVDFTTGSSPASVACSDLDGDGKLDLVVANKGSNSVSVFRNTATNDNMNLRSFAAKVDFSTGSNPYSVATGDLDGDGKPDLAVANNGSKSVSVFRNTSTKNSIRFVDKVDLTTGLDPVSVAIGDLDEDHKPDLAVANNGSSTVSVIQNTSTRASITFAEKVDFTTGLNPSAVVLGDMDGDGKTDLIAANYTSTSVSVIRSTANVSSLSFSPSIDFATGGNPYSVVLGDLDGDGKPDLALANNTSNRISVLRNADLPPTIISFSPLSAKPGESVTLTGTNFNANPTKNVVFFGATRGTVTAATTTSVTVTVPTGATYALITLLNTGTSLAAYSLNNFTPL